MEVCGLRPRAVIAGIEKQEEVRVDDDGHWKTVGSVFMGK